MKSLLLVQFFASVVSLSYAANWSRIEHEGDELEGAAAYSSYGYENETGRIVLYDNDSQIKVIAGKYSFFDHKSNYGDKELSNYAIGIVGFYEKGALTKKANIFVDVIRDKPDQGFLIRKHNLMDPFNFDILEIHNHLCVQGNSVRFKLSRYGKNQDFDVTAPYNPDFEKFDYIPINIERKKLEETIKAKKEELEKARKKVERITKQVKIQYAEMTNKLAVLKKRYNMAVKNNYMLSAKKQKAEIEKLQKELDKFVRGIKKDLPTAFD